MANYGGRGYARRKEIALAKGFPSVNAYQKASKAERLAATQALAARDPSYAKTRAVELVRHPPVDAPKRRRLDLGNDRELVQTMRNRELIAFLRRADAAGLNVTATVTGPDHAGRPSVTTLWRKGGIDPSYILDELDAEESRDVIAWLQDYIDNAGGNRGGVSGHVVQIQGLTFTSGAGEVAA